jgi:hypothetical protein
MAQSEIDLTEAVECDYCGARAGEPCVTVWNNPARRTHACRVALFEFTTNEQRPS